MRCAGPSLFFLLSVVVVVLMIFFSYLPKEEKKIDTYKRRPATRINARFSLSPVILKLSTVIIFCITGDSF